MSEKDKGFTVKDRRVFAQEGDGPAEETPPSAEPPRQEPEPAPAAEARQRQEPPLPQINFPTFVASLNASALVHLGVIEDPVSGKAEKNLPMAKQTIDILSMLQEKTSGNLNPDEAEMLKSILYDLRILYVKEKR
jgi:PBP1b-binding outer membrane lipoprotein LpoB